MSAVESPQGQITPDRGGWTSIPRLQQLMREDGLDAIVAGSPWNFIYASGCHLVMQDLLGFFESREQFPAVVVPANGEPVLTAWGMEASQIRAVSWLSDVRPAAPSERTVQILAGLIEEKGLSAGRVGIEKQYMHAGAAEELTALLPRVRFEAGDPTLTRARRVKSPFEIEMLSRAAMIAAKATHLAWELAQPGDDEFSVAANIVANVIRFGGAPLVFNMGAGLNSDFGHRWANDKRLVPGDLFHADSKARVAGYWADVSRMAVVGKPTDYQASVYRKLVAIELEIIDRARPGVPARELYAVADAAYKREGLTLKMGMDSIGHSIGLCLHEEPELTADCQGLLEPGMVITVEPGFRIPGGKLHYEDMVVITEGAPRILSGYCDTSELYVIE